MVSRAEGAGPEAFVPRTIPLPDLQVPESAEVHVWYLDLGLLGGPLQQALSGEQPGRGHRLTPGQRRFARRFYLRLLIGAYLGLAGKDVSVSRSVRGKPALDTAVHPTPLQFSLAKSEDRVLIGICSHCPIGVDLEPAQRRPHNAMRVAHRYFHPDEACDLAALPPERRDTAFLRAWACKEAVVKASGQGIANQLCRFRIDTDPARPPAIQSIEGDSAGAWTLALLRPDPEFVGAVAVRRAQLDLKCFRLLPAA